MLGCDVIANWKILKTIISESEVNLVIQQCWTRSNFNHLIKKKRINPPFKSLIFQEHHQQHISLQASQKCWYLKVYESGWQKHWLTKIMKNEIFIKGKNLCLVGLFVFGNYINFHPMDLVCMLASRLLFVWFIHLFVLLMSHFVYWLVGLLIGWDALCYVLYFCLQVNSWYLADRSSGSIWAVFSCHNVFVTINPIMPLTHKCYFTAKVAFCSHNVLSFSPSHASPLSLLPIGLLLSFSSSERHPCVLQDFLSSPLHDTHRTVWWTTSEMVQCMMEPVQSILF